MHLWGLHLPQVQNQCGTVRQVRPCLQQMRRPHLPQVAHEGAMLLHSPLGEVEARHIHARLQEPGQGVLWRCLSALPVGVAPMGAG